MPNKKINQLDVRVAVATDLMLVGDPSTGTAYKSTLDALPLVPYTGATTNVNLGEFQLATGQVSFDQTPTGTAGVGIMRWNDSDGTVDLGLKGGNVTLQVGQEQVQRVVNKSGVNLLEANYQVVKVTSAQGQRLAVDLAQGDSDANSTDTIGIVTETINNNQEGFITTSGLVRQINTTGSLQGETWADGDVLYLSPTVAGQITNIKPTAPNHTVILGYVVYSHGVNGKIFVKCDNGYELQELHNVYAPSPNNNEGIFWNSANSRYENNTIAGALGYTPVPYTGATGAVNLGAYDLTVNGLTVGKGASNISTNTALGISNLATVTTALYNTAVGVNSLAILTSGNYNTALGGRTLYLNQVGVGNTAVGIFSLTSATNDYNTALGASSGQSLTTGTYNTFIGKQAGFSITTGSNNIVISSRVTGGSGITTGSYNTIIGNEVSGLPTTTSNNIILADGQGNIRFRDDATSTILSRLAGTGTRMVVTDANGALSTSALPQASLTLTTTGTSGAATLIGSTLNIPQYSGGGGGSMAIGGAITSATAGSVLFAGASGVLQQDNANLFWDDTNNRLGIGTTAPVSELGIVGNKNSAVGLYVKNSNSSSSASSYFAFGQSPDASPYNAAFIEHYSGSFTTSGFRLASSVALISGAGCSNGFSFVVDVNSTSAVMRFIFSNTEKMRIFNNGNLLLQNGGTFTDAGYRLDVNGTARVSTSLLTGTFLEVGTSLYCNLLRPKTNSTELTIYSPHIPTYGVTFWQSYNDTDAFTSGTRTLIRAGITFNPTSGTAVRNQLLIDPIINQTGGASGISRGLYVNPTLTAAADWRAIEVGSGITILGASTTAKASLRIPSGTAPTTPADGDIWFDGTDLKMRIGGVTKTFTLI